MRSCRCLLPCIVCLLAAPVLLDAAEYEQVQGKARLRLEVDRYEDGQIENRLSSPMRLTLVVEGQAPLRVGPGDDEAIKEQVETLQQSAPWLRCEAVARPERTPLGDGRERWQVTFLLDPLPPKGGTLEVRPASLTCTEGPDGTRFEATWQPVAVRITTTVASTDVKTELRPITPPEELPLPPSWLRWLPWAGIAVAVAGLVAGGWSLRRRLARAEPPAPPHVWAGRELDRIEGLGLPARGEVERYHTLLCDVVRAYLERRFQLPASHQTTVEFLETMRRAPQLTPAQQCLLRDFLEQCDMAKFARAAPTPEECRAVAGMARSFVQQTTPA